MNRQHSKEHSAQKQWLKSLAMALILGLGLTIMSLGGLWVGVQARDLTTPGNPMAFPEPGSHTVPQTASVGIDYDEPIDPATVNTRTFAVHAMQGGQLLGTYDVPGGDIVLTPTRPFFPGELVMASATTGTLSDIDGTGPLTPTVWMFRAAVTKADEGFIRSIQELGQEASTSIALGDLDLDGDLDAVVTNGASPNEIWFNQGGVQGGVYGLFIKSGQSLPSSASRDVVLGDVDSDGDLDIYELNRGVPNRILLNQGGLQGGIAGVFVNSGQALGGTNTSISGALGDIDGDGDLDAVEGNDGVPNRVYLNNGLGEFVATGQLLGAGEFTYEVVLGDLDGDLDLDLYVANRNQPDQIWFNNGDGLFTNSGQELEGGRAVGAALGDLDLDGDLDVFIANDLSEPDTVRINQGGMQGGTAGVMLDSGQLLGSASSQAVNLGDVDADGDLDAFTVGYASPASALWLNDGLGVFTDSGIIFAPSTGFDSEMGDLNNDGDLDIFIVNIESEPNHVWMNNKAPLLEEVEHAAAVLENQPVTLTGKISDTDTINPHILLIDWGDGVTDTDTLPGGTIYFTKTHTYLDDDPSFTAFDEYDLQVEVIDSEFGAAIYNGVIVVSNTAPILTEVLLQDMANENDEVTLTGVFEDASPLDTFLLNVVWGDGQTDVYNYPAGQRAFTETHRYLDDEPTGTPADTYTVELALVDDDSGFDVAALQITLNNLPPVATAGPDVELLPGQLHTFTAAFSDVGTLDTHMLHWDFGDGNDAAGTLTATHSYDNPGIYTATFSVVDDDTGTGSDHVRVTVADPVRVYYYPIMVNQVEGLVAPVRPARPGWSVAFIALQIVGLVWAAERHRGK